jgi:hypothetical protein
MNMSDYKIERESVLHADPELEQIVLRLKTNDGQYRQYSYVLSKTDKPEEIADLEEQIEKLLVSTLRK